MARLMGKKSSISFRGKIGHILKQNEYPNKREFQTTLTHLSVELKLTQQLLSCYPNPGLSIHLDLQMRSAAATFLTTEAQTEVTTSYCVYMLLLLRFSPGRGQKACPSFSTTEAIDFQSILGPPHRAFKVILTE